MSFKRVISTLFQKQPIEKGDDMLAASIRQEIREMKKSLNRVDSAIEDLLARSALSKDSHNAN